ncbi:MAG TPA: YbaB/EbfC family nucleoid-associated protein [Gemmatimonadales bacterium]|nr:YbaB/EbfC family nucleoid-associated protein [Gemmatimonadales bacterium]
MADFQQLMQLGQQVQGRWQDIQRDLASRTVEATAGGGMVRVAVDGRGQLRGVWIDPTVFADRDADLLSELVLSAVAQAQRRADELAQADLQRLPAAPPGP